MKIVFIEPLGVEPEKLQHMAQECVGDLAELVFWSDRREDVKTLIERSKDADVVVLSNLPYPREVIEQCPKLSMITVAFTGVDHVAMDACRERGIVVSNCAGYSTVAVADLVFGFVLALYRRLKACDKAVRECGTKDGLVGFELEGKKFGIVGAGAIGLRTASIAQAFGCEVYAYSRTPKEIPGITFTDLHTLLAESDIVSLHVPLNEQTRGLIGADELRRMKPSALLINTARGPVVDSEALAEALKDGTIAGAGVDVFEMEPPVPKEHPLFGAPNLIASPHVAFASKEAMYKRAVIVMEDLKAYLAGKPIHVM